MTESERWRAKAISWVALAGMGGDPKLAQYLIDVAADASELADELECEEQLAD
jgi:hypothetical protein